MKTVTFKVEEDLHLQLKAAAKSYGESLNDYLFRLSYQAIENINGGFANLEIYYNELKRLKNL